MFHDLVPSRLPIRVPVLFGALAAALATLHPLTVHAVSSHVKFAANGAAPTDQFGVAAAAGDFNADGVPDVLVGAPTNDAGGLNAGRAYVYSGARLGDPPLLITGQTGERLGWATAAAGDVNGDGWDDVLIGAPLNDVGGTDAGRAYLLFGGPNADGTPDLTLTGLAPGEQFGSSLAAAGDMNGDGFDDFVVGAYLNDGSGMDAGRAYVFYGAAIPDATPDLTLTGAPGDQYGVTVASAGDINADGYGDIVIGAWLNDNAGPDAGAAYVLFGGAVADTTPDLTLRGTAPGEKFGVPAVQIGDADGDCHPDLLVGATSNDVNGTNAGAAYLFKGGPTADAVADLVLLGADAGDGFGSTPSAAGDVNGDGYADFAVGAPAAGPNTDGLVYIYLGAPTLDVTADLVLSPPTTADDYGSYIETVGDIDLDGYSDLVVADVTDDAAGTNAGRMYIISVYPYQLVLPTVGEVWRAGSRVTVAWRGCVPADLELVLDDREPIVLARRVGGLDLNNIEIEIPDRIELDVDASLRVTIEARLRITVAAEVATRATSVTSARFNLIRYPIPPAISSDLNFTMSYAPLDTPRVAISADVNGDGLADLVVGIPSANSGVGKALVHLATGRTPTGKPKFQSTPIMLALGTQQGRFGWSLAAGDVNGDCVQDVAVGAPKYDGIAGTDGGRVVVFFGGTSFDNTPDWVVEGNAPGEQLGYAVALVADMNGDEYDDLACGAPFSDATGPDAGRVQLFYGSPSPDPVGDLALNGEAAGDNMGTSIAALPNPDGGGVDWCEIFPWMCPVLSGALLVGAPFNDLAGLDAGAAYVFTGGLEPEPQPALIMRGRQAEEHFGMTVAAIGDFDGDRIGDFAIAAPDGDCFDPPCPDAGRVYVRHFDPRCFVIDPWPSDGVDPWFLVVEGDAGDRFGLSLAGADVNHDGLSDLVVASPNHDGPAGVDAGRVSIFQGQVGPPEVSGDIGPNHGVDPDWLVDRGAANERLGSVLAVTEAVGNQVGPPDAPGRVEPFAARRRCIRRLSAQAPAMPGAAQTHETHPQPDAPTPMIGGDLLLGRLATAPELRFYDLNRYHLLAPLGPATWSVGSLQTVSWKGTDPAAVQLSIDGGATYATIATSTGGNRTHSATIRVPHLPTRFGMLRVIPWPPCPPDPFGLTCPPFLGFAQSDTLMTIQASVSLLTFAAQRMESGAELRWSTNPGVGPSGLAGYRLYRVEPGSSGDGTRIGPELIAEERYLDAGARPGASYRLASVNGLGEEMELGRTDLEADLVGIQVIPSPVSGHGQTRIRFAAPMAAPGLAATDLDVGVFDVTGRRVATLARGAAEAKAGTVSLEWRPSSHGAHPGLYFVRLHAPSARVRVERKVVVIP
jgi:hypothetical protein